MELLLFRFHVLYKHEGVSVGICHFLADRSLC